MLRWLEQRRTRRKSRKEPGQALGRCGLPLGSGKTTLILRVPAIPSEQESLTYLAPWCATTDGASGPWRSPCHTGPASCTCPPPCPLGWSGLGHASPSPGFVQTSVSLVLGAPRGMLCHAHFCAASSSLGQREREGPHLLDHFLRNLLGCLWPSFQKSLHSELSGGLQGAAHSLGQQLP